MKAPEGDRKAPLCPALHDSEGVPVKDDRKPFEFLAFDAPQAAGLNWEIGLRNHASERVRQLGKLPVAICGL